MTQAAGQGSGNQSRGLTRMLRLNATFLSVCLPPQSFLHWVASLLRLSEDMWRKTDRTGVFGWRTEEISYSRSDNVYSWEEVICRKQRWCQKESWPQTKHMWSTFLPQNVCMYRKQERQMDKISNILLYYFCEQVPAPPPF